MATLDTPDAFAHLPHIEPDPQLQLSTWDPELNKSETQQMSDLKWRKEVRRAFIMALVARHSIPDIASLREAVRRRFGAQLSLNSLRQDIRDLGIVTVPNPGGGKRLKLVSQLHDARIEDELDERLRIDGIRLDVKGDTLHLECNRGTTQALVQLLNLVHDDGYRQGLLSLASDGDKWVTIHLRDGHAASAWERWLRPKIL